MRFRSTLRLIVVLAVLCVFYLLLLRSERKAQEQTIEAKRLFAFPAEEVQELSITQEDLPETMAKRTDDGVWSISKPHFMEANQVLWNRLAGEISRLLNERVIEESPKDLTLYELDEPRLTVGARAKSGVHLHVTFGKTDPTAACRYAQINKGPVVLISDKSYKELDRPLLWLRERRLFTLSENEVTRIEMGVRVGAQQAAEEGRAGETTAPLPQAPAEEQEWRTVIFERSGEKEWRMLRPMKVLANQETVGKLLREILSAMGDEFVDQPESLDQYGLDLPILRILLLAGQENRRQTAEFGSLTKQGDKGYVFAKRDNAPSVFMVDASVLEAIPATPSTFWEARLLAPHDAGIKAIRYRADKTDLTFEYSAEKGWGIRDKPARDTDQLAVERFVRLISQLKGQVPVGEAKPEFGLDKPVATIMITRDDGTERVVLVGAETPGNTGRYVAQDTGYVTWIGKEEAALLLRNEFDFMAKQLLAFNVKEAVKVELDMDGVRYVFEKSSRRWSVSAPPGKAWSSQADMAALLETMNPVMAVGVESERVPADLVRYGLDAPVLTVRVITRAEATRQETVIGPLKIGKTCGENSRLRYAVAESYPGIFRVRQSVMDGVRDAMKGIVDKAGAEKAGD